jgi:hypothetical protein
MRRRSRAASLSGVLLLCATLGSALAQDAPDSSAMATYLLNFARYTEWPAQKAAALDQELTLCVIGNDSTAANLASLERRSIRGRELRVRSGIGLEAIEQCDILFVSATEQGKLEPILRAAGDRAILTVSDIAGFAEAGGMIGLVLTGHGAQFDVNLRAVRRSSLWLSPQVLRLARTVIGAKEMR